MAAAQKDHDSWPELLNEFVRAWPLQRWRDVGIVIGCSGGADSVALALAICQTRAATGVDPARGFVLLAHFNHGIRGRESDDDQRFVQRLAEQLGIQSEIGSSDSTACDESTLRDARLDFLQATARRCGARYVAVAHSADDNVETVLHHLMRGTGPTGMSGIPTARSFGGDLVLVRPLLAVRRSLIRRSLQTIGQPWREDSSNNDTAYRRNWIRGELLPMIESQYPDAVAAISRAIDGQRGWRETIDQLATSWLHDQGPGEQGHGEQGHGEQGPGGLSLGHDAVELTHDSDTDESIVVAALQQLWAVHHWPCGGMSRRHWLRLAKTIRQHDSDRYTLPGGLEVSSTKKIVKLQRHSK